VGWGGVGGGGGVGGVSMTCNTQIRADLEHPLANNTMIK